MSARWYSVVAAVMLFTGSHPPKSPWVETIKRIQHSIVPVVCAHNDEKGAVVVDEIEGTGFFVDRSGRFVTASHVLDGLDAFVAKGHKCGSGIYVPDKGWGQFTKTIAFQSFAFVQCRRIVSTDIAVCQCIENPFNSKQLKPESIQEVSFDSTELADGTPVAFSGFPLGYTSPITAIGNIAEPIREFRKSWATACRLASVHRLFHDLRRSAARNMLNAGVPQAIAMQVTGHKTDSMFRRYAIVAPNDVRTALRTTQEYTASEMAKAATTEASASVN